MLRFCSKVAGISALAASLALFSSSPVQAVTVVDGELFLSLDVSGSISNAEFELQRTGYLTAFNNPAVRSQILSSNGFAVAVGQWASTAFTPLAIGWTNIADETNFNTFVSSLATLPRQGSGGTSVNAGINAGVAEILSNDFDGSTLIIDISGDGTSSSSLTQAARDNAQANGITINGLPIGGTFIENFYTNNVITQDGAIFPAATFADFEAAVVTKIQAEVGEIVPPENHQVPGPLPVLGAAAAFGYSRKLKTKLRNRRLHEERSA